MIHYKLMPPRRQSNIPASPFHHYYSDDGTVWTEFYKVNDGYLLRFPELADFEVTRDGTEVIAHPTHDVDENTVEHLYINQLLPLAMSRQGQPAFHASVVVVPGGAVAFLGDSGMGKSTLAASFALNGAAFLTDDALIIEETSEGCQVQPCHASLRLWTDSVDALISKDTARAAPVRYTSKTRLLAGAALAYADEPQPLLAAFAMQRLEVQNIKISTISGLERYMAWIGNSFLLDVEDHELLSRHFEWTHRISGTVPTYSLDYPRDYGMLSEVRTAVQQQVAEIGN